MEQNSLNSSISSNGISLQLRSKEVSEVMGNIPAWIGSWGVFLIGFFFLASILFISNIHLAEKIPGKASIDLKHTQFDTIVHQHIYLRIAIPAHEYSKVKTSEFLTVMFREGARNLYNQNIKLAVDTMRFSKDTCFVQFLLDPAIVNKIRREEPALNTISNVNCELVVNMSVFQKAYGGIF